MFLFLFCSHPSRGGIAKSRRGARRDTGKPAEHVSGLAVLCGGQVVQKGAAFKFGNELGATRVLALTHGRKKGLHNRNPVVTGLTEPDQQG